MFNLNIDDLLNNDINEVKKEESSKNNINKYIDDFLNFISNTVKMICSLDLKTKIKCFSEQVVIVVILIIAFHLIGSILGNLLLPFVKILPHSIYNFIYQLLGAIYLILTFILVVVIMVHVFKTRYLDYYTKTINEDYNLTKENDTKNIKNDKEKESNKNLDNGGKIVIRDPKHSEYKFIKGLLKLINLGVKFVLLCIILFLCFSLVIILSSLVLSFKISGAKIFFIGLLIILISISVIDVLFITIFINFIVSRKNNNKVNIMVFVSFIILCGIGFGLLLNGTLNFDYIELKDSGSYKTNEAIIPINNGVYFNDHMYEINYIEEERDDIRVRFKSNKYCNTKINYDEEVYFNIECNNKTDMIKEYLKGINKEKIYSLDNKIYDIEVYASNENINIIKQNRKSAIRCEKDEQELSDKNYKLEREIEEYKRIIEELKEGK